MDVNLENGKIVTTENGFYCVDKYYRDYVVMLKDFEEITEQFINNDFEILSHKFYIMNRFLTEEEFREEFVDTPQEFVIPGYRYMVKIYLKGKE
jgi:hypothetical protein